MSAGPDHLISEQELPPDGRPAEAAAGAAEPQRRGRHRTAEGQLVRQEVIRRAAALFDEAGYHQTSMEDIAEAIGLSKPTLYHYFDSKSEILFWIHEEFIDLLITRQQRRLQSPLGPEQLVLEIMADILELMETHRGHVRAFFENHRELPPEERAAIARKRAVYADLVQDAIKRGVDAGVFRAFDPPELATLALFGICNWAYQWYRSDGQLRSREIAYVFWELFLHGIGAPQAD